MTHLLLRMVAFLITTKKKNNYLDKIKLKIQNTKKKIIRNYYCFNFMKIYHLRRKMLWYYEKKFEHPHPFHSCISFTCCFCLFEVSSCLLFHNNAGSFTYKFLPNILFVSSLFPAKNHKLVFFHSKPRHI